MSKKPPLPPPEQTPEGVTMSEMAAACQEQSGAIAHLKANPSFDPQFWMTTALDDLDAAVRQFIATVSQHEGPADGPR